MRRQTTALPPAGRIRVLLVEDHPAAREGLRAAIECQPDLCVAGETDSWQVALRLVRELGPDVVVLDLNLSDGNGWSLLEQLRSLGAVPPTLILSVCDEAVYARRLFRAGARGYLMKDEPVGCVLEAIREIHAGRLAASPALRTQLMLEALQGAEPPGEAADPDIPNTLSDREMQVFSLLARGLINREIAGQLRVSEKSVHTYKTRLMTKLQVRTTPELAALFHAWQVPARGAPGSGRTGAGGGEFSRRLVSRPPHPAPEKAASAHKPANPSPAGS